MNSSWRFCVLGRVELAGPEGILRPERKLAACLSYLALEGPTHRARLVGLLWPDSPEATARNNLSQMLRKLRLATDSDLVVGTDVLSLTPELTVDAAEVRETATQGHLEALLVQGGELLPGLRYDDCPDLDDWLTAERERFLEWRMGALKVEIARLEREGQYAEALTHARSLLDLDPVSEEAHRGVMRLHYLHGDRPAALRAYHQCQEVLRREFDVDPLPETAALAREIDRGTVAVVRPAKRAELPLSVLRPPRLLGREREWARMEEAWQGGQVIFLRGDPGSGKTRLASDFAASKGAHLRLEGRPGDRSQPFSTATRLLRMHLAQRPDVPLEPWERQELARLLPELAQAELTQTPPNLSALTDQARFQQAALALVRRSSEGLAAFVTDDMQYFDQASFELGGFFMSSAFPLGSAEGLPHFIDVYRRGELSAATEAALHGLVASGMAVIIDVPPLPNEDMSTLLDDLGMPEDPAGRARLVSATGGNPLFLLETVKHLLEMGQLADGLPEQLPLPDKVGQLIGRRLSLLSAPALQAARAAAILQRDFDVELVAAVLHAPLFDAMQAWEELEEAQIVRGERFSHDLLYETIRAGIPPSVRLLLHRNAAKALEAAGADPARIARHWLDGERPAQAAPLLRQAADYVRARYQLAEAARFLHQAAGAFAASNDPDAAFDALAARAETLGHLEDRAAREAALADALVAARRPLQQARVWQLTAEMHLTYHEGEATEAASRHGLALLAHDPLPTPALAEQRANLEATVGAALWVQGRMLEAAETLRRAVTAQQDLGESAALAANLSNLGVILDHLEQHREATVHHRRACELMERAGNWSDLTAALSNLAVSLLDQGEVRAALVAALRANELTARAGSDHAGAVLGHLNTGQIYHALAQYDQALHHYDLATQCGREGTWHAGFIPTLRADTRLLLGDLDGAARDLEESRAAPNIPDAYRARTLAALADLALLRGEDAHPWLEQAEALLGEHPRPFTRGRLWLLQAQVVQPEQALELAHETLLLAQSGDLGGMEIAARVRAAQALLALGRPDDALEHAHTLERLLETREPAVVTRGEALLTLAQVLAAGDLGAVQVAAQAQGWLDATQVHHVPEVFRSLFLTHPVHRAIAGLSFQVGAGAEGTATV